MNRRKMKEFLVGLTVVTCVCLTVVLFNTNKISSKASSGEVVYATFTNPNSKNVTTLSNKSAYGKVSKFARRTKRTLITE